MRKAAAEKIAKQRVLILIILEVLYEFIIS